MLKVWKNKWIAGFLIVLLISNTLLAAGLGFAASVTDENRTLLSLGDRADIADYAVANLATMVQEGLIKGAG